MTSSTDHLALKYDKTNLREHILQRPDSYCGSKLPKKETAWTLKTLEPEVVLEEREVTYVPAFCSLLDELLANACDRTQVDPECQEIRVEFDAQSITVFNTGKGIPVVVHPKHNLLVPRMIFGELLTSENYDDRQKRTTGGRNGLGAKLCNVYSTQFRVETSCAETHRKFVGVWSQNMTQYSGDQTSPAAAQDYTRVTYWPDWAKLNLRGFTTDHQALLGRRVVDMAGTLRPGVKVYLNKKRIKIGSFRDYMKLYLPPETDWVYEECHERWQVGLASAPEAEFRQVSFVNNLATAKGGTHVECVVQEIIKGCLQAWKKTHKDMALRPGMVRSRMWIFVNARIENPTFSSQTKDELQTPLDQFGSRPNLERVVKRVLSKKLLEGALDLAKLAQDKQLTKTDGSKRATVAGVPKLEDANKAGGRESHLCTLWLTEGDSAKALVISGLSTIGRDYHGVFPLRGKLINVREATTSQLTTNEEIIALKKILGLKQGVEYTDVKELRYGRVMITTDADKDGSHIKGLIINFFHHFWPSLLTQPGFLCEFITPMVRATRGSQEAREFYNQYDFQSWLRDQRSLASWDIKYYKGLGTSTRDDARRYFSDLDRHVIEFRYQDHRDDQALALAFDEKQVEQRKHWLSQPAQPLEREITELSYHDFVHRELVYFSWASNERAIPHLMDGLKPSQRKILYTMLRKKVFKDEKVATIAGYVMQMAAYHHGEASLAATTVGMAQDFCGSNNINLLHPAGQFGTRALGGKDSASARYIFTRLSEITPELFREEDHSVLQYVEDDGKVVEPVYYVPILPLVLVNGANGIGTGYSTTLPCYRPQDIIRNLLHLMEDRPLEPMHPWYRHFQGPILAVPEKPGKYLVQGVVRQTATRLVEILELPVGVWTQDYKRHLERMADQERLVRFEEHHTDFQVHFKIHLTDAQMANAQRDFLVYFRLTETLTTTNMVLFSSEGRLTKYESVQDILREFYRVRLDFYRRRRIHQIQEMEQQLVALTDRARFIQVVNSGELELRNRPEQEVHDYLTSHGFTSPFQHLWSLEMRSMTEERAQKLQKEAQDRQAVLEKLRVTSELTLWRAELMLLAQRLAAVVPPPHPPPPGNPTRPRPQPPVALPRKKTPASRVPA